VSWTKLRLRIGWTRLLPAGGIRYGSESSIRGAGFSSHANTSNASAMPIAWNGCTEPSREDSCNMECGRKSYWYFHLFIFGMWNRIFSHQRPLCFIFPLLKIAVPPKRSEKNRSSGWMTMREIASYWCRICRMKTWKQGILIIVIPKQLTYLVIFIYFVVVDDDDDGAFLPPSKE